MEEEKKNEKKKSSGVLIILLVIILLFVAVLGGYWLGTTKVSKESKKQKNEEIEEVQEETKDLELTDDIKSRLEKFVLVGSNYDYSGNTTLDNFSEGTKEIPKKVKLRMARNSVYKYGEVKTDVTISDDVVSKLTGVKPDNGEIVDIITKTSFEKAYKELFNENPEYTYDEISGCPAPLAIDESTGEMYLFHRCGGTGVITFNTKVVSYDADTEYYYVHTETEKKDLSNNEVTKNLLVWKFDKDYKFVSTEKE